MLQAEIHSLLVSVEKGKFGASTLSHKIWYRKQTIEPKWLILVYFFFSEDSLHPLIPLLNPRIIRSMPFRFYWATCMRGRKLESTCPTFYLKFAIQLRKYSEYFFSSVAIRCLSTYTRIFIPPPPPPTQVVICTACAFPIFREKG